IEEFTGEPIKYLIITHFDDDHMAGTQVFRDAEIIAHENSTKYYGKQIFSNPAAKASILGLSNQLQKALESVEPDSPAAERLKKYISYFGPSFLEGFDGYEFTPPTILIGSTAEIRLGNTIARIHHPGPGHTDTDLVVLLPREKVFIAGDLILDHGMAPVIHLRNGGSVLNLINTLEKFKGMLADYEYVVPGHGPVHKGETISDMLVYLCSLKGSVKSYIEQGYTLEKAMQEIKVETHSEHMLYDLFHAGNIAAAWSELTATK
ncbi:MAG TPA: MBL fold metallo-hydrolase, partial [Acidobacteriota bacterium]|nr:MBL fold metallo-hydrolase [Acidobacteriota bacterium]